MHTDLIPGTRYTHPYPFVRKLHWEEDEGGPSPVPGWKPGTVPRDQTADAVRVAHGIGTHTLTLLDVYVVPHGRWHRYHRKAIYVQQWKNPDGVAFGKGMLHWCGLPKFARLAAGYAFPYTLEAAQAAPYFAHLLERHRRGATWLQPLDTSDISATRPLLH